MIGRRNPEPPTVNISRKDRAVAAFKKSRPRTDEEIAAFARGYEAAEWDFEMASMRMRVA